MKAAVLFNPGDLRVVEVEKPKVGEQDVLLRVKACAICGSDISLIKNPWPDHPPFGEYIPGHEYAGEVVEVGSNVFEFKPGDRVATQVHKGCMRCKNCMSGNYTACLNYGDIRIGHRVYGVTVNGGFAEYALNHCTTLYKIPENVSFEEATIITTAGCALYAIDLANSFITGECVVVFGPGPIGLMLVQLLKAYSASNIVLVGTRKSRLDLGYKLGANFIFKNDENNLLDRLLEANNGNRYDLTFECAGVKQAVDDGLNLLKRGGRLILVANYQGKIDVDLSKIVKDKLAIIGVRGEGNRSCGRVIELARQKKIDLSSIITHKFNLDEINKAIFVYENRVEDAIKVVVEI
jgi:L-iditol 2-dehydrogenase